MDIEWKRRPDWISICAFTSLLICSLTALYRPLIGYDSWWYHLPFSSYLWDIGGGSDTFHLSHYLLDRFAGFPKAWEWIQGLAWRMTGTLRSIIIPQLLLCAAYFMYVSRAQGIPLSWMILAFFASPMLFIHFQSIYLDLPAAILIALGFLLLVDLIDAARNSSQSVSWRRCVAVVACLGLAGNIKYQALLGSLCVAGIVSAACIVTADIPVRRRMGIVAIACIAAVISSASALSNLAKYHNPFYPLELNIRGKTIFPGPENPEVDAAYPTYARYSYKATSTFRRQISVPAPLNFFLSATEFDWTLRGVVPWYNQDSNAGEVARVGGPSRTGGWGGVFVIANGFLLLLQLVRLRREEDRRQRLLVVSAVAVIVVTACLPRSHELRYWLYLPLMLIPVNLRYIKRHYESTVIAGILFALMAYGAANTLLSPDSRLWGAHPTSAAALRAAVPSAVAQAVRETGRFCTANDEELPFRYSFAVTGVPSLISTVEADCEAHGALFPDRGVDHVSASRAVQQ